MPRNERAKKPAPGGRGKPDAPSGGAHIVTVGTTPATGDDIIEVLVDDLKELPRSKVVVLATEDSRENAERLLRGLRLANTDRGRVVELASAQSIDEAYRVANGVFGDLEGEGFHAEDVTVHYTAGTKMMSAGVVLAAVGRGCESLRYLYSRGRKERSEAVVTASAAVRVDGDLRLARTLIRELRFRSAGDILDGIDEESTAAEDRSRVKALKVLAPAYAAWDNFRVRSFLEGYRRLGKLESGVGEFRVSKEALAALRKVARVETTESAFPVEHIADIYNNALRRLLERRTDDAMTRLYRVAEMYAQNILITRFRIRTDDVDVRKVPPRSRVIFEALRRLDDAKVRIGLRKSFELLAVLEHPAGEGFLRNEKLQEVLDERRYLVLAHGTKPASAGLALAFLEELLPLLRSEFADFEDLAALQQFPWIDNGKVLGRLRDAKDDQSPLSITEKPQRARRGRARGGRSRGGGGKTG